MKKIGIIFLAIFLLLPINVFAGGTPETQMEKENFRIIRKEEAAEFDFSGLENGFFKVKREKDNGLWIVLLEKEIGGEKKKFYYDFESDGEFHKYLLPWGSGEYSIRLSKHRPDKGPDLFQNYSVAMVNYFEKEEVAVTKYLESNHYVNLEKSPSVVQKAGWIAKNKTEAQKIGIIYKWILTFFEYDDEKAEKQLGKFWGVNLNIEETYHTGKGICTEISITAAAMLRSQGIPARVVAGRTATGSDKEGHMWLEIYPSERVVIGKGRILEPNQWNRLDPTNDIGKDLSKENPFPDSHYVKTEYYQ